MHYFIIGSEALPDGNYRPTLELETSSGSGKTFTNFSITKTFETDELARERARHHALDEARKQRLSENDFEIREQ